MDTTAAEPRIYVGTYAKYNSGSIAGAWIDLDKFAGDRDGFLEACKELHKDEPDPELMFQDFEGFPRDMYSESNASEELFAWLDLDEDDRELLAVYQQGVDQSGTLEQARDAFMGKHDNAADWAASWLEETGGLEGVPEHLKNYIDYESYARDAGHDGVTFVRHDGDLWVFNS